MKKVKFQKKALSLLMVLCMMISLFAGMSISASADESGSCTNISTLSYGSGEYRITSSGRYYLESTITDATILVQLPDSDQGYVEICGDGISASNIRNTITIDCNEGTRLRLKDLYIRNSAEGTSPEHGGAVASGASAVRFTGSGNILDISGNVLIESTTYVTSACIAVNAGTELEVTGSDTSCFYIYKYSQGCGIGADANNCNGNITFTSGNLFMKGSKTGALIGNDAGEVTTGNGDIIINGGNINLVNKAQGAAIGGSKLSYAGNVYVNGGNVSIVTDFSAPAIGAGAQKKSIDGANGSLIISGGSLKTMIMDNAYSSWGVGSTEERHIVSGTSETYVVDHSTITAAVTDRSSEAAALYKLNDSSVNGSNNVVTVDGQLFYSGGIHQYEYSDSALNGSGTTMSNWQAVPAADSEYNSLYLYLTKENHLLTINGNYYKLVWNTASASFSTIAVEPVRVGTGGYSSISQAASVLGSSEGVIEITEPVNVSGSETISLAEGQYIARGYHVSGNLITVNSGANLTLGSGTIFSTAGNASTGSLIYVNGGSFTMNGGALLGNHATNGGAINAVTGVLSVNGGLISGNTADIYGDGIYSAVDINMTPSGMLDLSDTVFLAPTKKLIIGASLNNINNKITVQTETPESNPVVAVGDEYFLCSDDVSKIEYVDPAFVIELSQENAVVTDASQNRSDQGLSTLETTDPQLMEDTLPKNGTITGGTAANPLVITLTSDAELSGGVLDIASGTYVVIKGSTGNETVKVANNSQIRVAKNASLTVENVTFDGLGTGEGNAFFFVYYGTLKLGQGTRCINRTANNTFAGAIATFMHCTSKSTTSVVIDGLEVENCNTHSGTISWTNISGENEIAVERSNLFGTYASMYSLSINQNDVLTIKGLTVDNSGVENGSEYDISNYFSNSYNAAIFEPTGEINIPGKITGGASNNSGCTIKPQEGYAISSMTVNGSPADVPTSETTIAGPVSGLQILFNNTPEFNASLANVTTGLVVKDETFTADVMLTSDSVPASAELDLSVNSDIAKIVSITPAEGIGTTDASVEENGSAGKVSFYGNTASAAEGLKVATVTFKAVEDGTAQIALTSGAAGISGDPADYDITLPESTTEVIVKTPAIEAVDFGGSYKLAKYTPNAVVEDGKTVKYGEQEMYLAADGCWYCVIDKDTNPSLDSVAITDGAQTAYTAVEPKGDVNENEKINIADAQIAYDISTSVYTGFDLLTVTGLLKADVNNDLKVDALDARAIQVYIHTGTFG